MRHAPASQHILTIDVEDYFQVAAFEAQIAPSQWDSLPCRVEGNVENLLALLERRNIKATFFTLGWIAERYPRLIRKIGDQGHELASHGYGHQRVSTLTEAQFRDDVRRARAVLEATADRPVYGYRAPSFSFSERTPWAADALQEAGYRYSSSINPVPHDLYGFADAPRTPFHWDNGLLEIPVTTCELFRRRLPCAGGGYFRLYPYALSRWLFRTAARQLRGPSVFYLHPWEIDPDQPRIPGASAKSRFRHYLNLHRTRPRLERLLSDFSWQRMCDLDQVRAVTV